MICIWYTRLDDKNNKAHLKLKRRKLKNIIPLKHLFGIFQTTLPPKKKQGKNNLMNIVYKLISKYLH